MTPNVSGRCSVCGACDLHPLLSLPEYPLNSLYLPAYDDGEKYRADLHLHDCPRCGHIQAISELPIEHFYNEAYSYTVNNAGAQGRQDFFVGRVLRHAAGKRFNRVIELGCFDLCLLKKLRAAGVVADHWIGIDPVPLHDAGNSDGIVFINGYCQDVDIPFLNEDLPDLIISDQVFEHIPSTRDVLQTFSTRAAPGSSFIVCVPSVELLIDNFSFHNVIHEHLNYFSAATLAKLFEACDYRLLHSELNNELTVGLLLQIYTTGRGAGRGAGIVDCSDLSAQFQRNYTMFKRTLASVRDFIGRGAAGGIYGFGASDITANLAYFIESDFAELRNIIDDTPYKQNRFIPRLKPLIVNSARIDDWSASTILITAPQANRPILGKLLQLRPKKIIIPVVAF
jgi:Methyltransferase domain/Putative zinc binding domain/C-methyltransferase C-terminal domain